MQDVRTVAVLGAGDMGHGVAELAALRGFEVRLRDVDAKALERAREAIRASLDKLAARNRVTREAADQAFARVLLTTDLQEAVGTADLVIEAVPERLDLKRLVFAEVEALAPSHAVLATNTSAIRIREIGRDLKDPSRLVGMHFFNPVLLMDLVEVIPSPATRPEALEAVQAAARRLGKTTVTLRKDTPGFVTSRLITTWVGAAVLCADHKLADREGIDAALRHRTGFPMGPFELADYTGLDVGLHAADYLADRLGPSYQPSLTLRALVERGDLGKKTGRGFYEWREGRLVTPIHPSQAEGFDPALVMAVVVNEAAKLLEQGVATAEEIDLAMRQGCAFPKGPFEWADEVGLDHVLKSLYTLEERTGSTLATPYELLVEMVEMGRLGRKAGKGFLLPRAAPTASPTTATSTAAPRASAPDGSASPVAPAASAPAASQGPAVAPAAAPQAAGYETVLVRLDPETHVGTVTLNRPHRLHALNAQLFRDLRAALRQMDEDDAVRVVLLTASGDKAFCAGADLTDASGATPAEMTRLARAGHMVCLEMEKMGKPVVAAINGHALGGGFELALPADFRLAARRATFALPEVTLGLLPAMGGTQRLPKLVGLARAKEIAMMGDRFDAQQALAWGLVHRVFENETFEQESRAFAARLAARAPVSLRLTKQLLNAAPTTDITVGMEAESAAFGVAASTEDMREGVSSMFARKTPSFAGR